MLPQRRGVAVVQHRQRLKSALTDFGLQPYSCTSSRGLGLSGQRTFPAKTFPERFSDFDVLFPKCDVLVPHVLPQFRTIVRPPISPPLISYLVRHPNPYLPLSITPKREGGRQGRERAPLRDHRVSPATTSRDRRTSFRRTDRPLPPVASRRSHVGKRDQ